MSDIDDLKNLSDLKVKGLITDEEFKQQKDALLNQNLKKVPAANGEQKSRLVYILLGAFLGYFGIHNFYAGYIGKGIAQLLITLFLGWLLFIPVLAVFVWMLIEVCTVTEDANGVPFTQ